MIGSNNIGVADIKDIMATGKRSQVARLVCESLLVILYGVSATEWHTFLLMKHPPVAMSEEKGLFSQAG